MVNTEADRAGALLPASAPRQFHLLVKPTGAVCNLDCTYCFFLSKELLYPGSRFRMADDLLETYLRQLIEAHAGAPEVVVAWQGGEPTMMGLDFFRRSVELADSMKQPRLAKRDTLPRCCLDCDVRFACHGGCPKDRFTTTPDGEPGLHYLCPSYKAFFGHIRPAMDAMCALLRAGRAPSELVRR